MTQIAHRPIGELTLNLDRKRIPVKAADRRHGPYPYYGASGVVDHVDDYLFEGLHLLVAEDGENLRSRKTPIAFLADGRFWVNNHAHVLQGNGDNDTRYLSYALEAMDISGYLTGSAQPKLSQAALAAIEVPAPPLNVQRAIAATLGSLDDKIESNRRAIEVALSLATASYERAALSASRERLGELATLVLGGTPSRKRPELWENGSIPWIASGAANAEIVMRPTELITQDALAHSAAKMMPKGATVIAITGATLGQVALLGIDTSGNQSLVGVWADKPALTAWLHLALRASMNDLIKSATGAAQQHVNKGNVAELMVPILEEEELDEWAAVNVPLIERCVQLEAESQLLTALRDTLLPELLSGRIRVRAEGDAA